MGPSPAWPLEESRAGTGRRRCVGQGRAPPAQDELAEASESGEPALQAPRRWGLSAEAVAHWGDRLSPCGLRLRGGLTPRPRDPSAHASDSRRAQWPRDTARNLATMARTLHGGEGQAWQPGMSTSPWAGHGVCRPRQAERKASPALAQGSTLMLEERAKEQAGTHNAGASRQDNGRRGKGDVGRGDPCLPSAHGGLGARVEGARCLPEAWCGAACAPRRTELGIPAERRGETPRQVGLPRGKRVQAPGLPLDVWAWDALDGRDRQLRAAVDAAGVRSAAPVPAATHVYRREPRVGLPPTRGQRGRPRTRRPGLRGQGPHAVRALAQPPQTTWPQGEVRPTARGRWTADCAVRRVWTVAAGQRPRAAWWVRRRHSEGDCASTRLHAPADPPQAWLSAGSCRRSCTERTLEEAKTASGWDACQAQQ